MFEDIIEAGSRVLCKFPPGRFNTIVVAEEAGISVGSLYQYFPDKASLLFAIQQRGVEGDPTWGISTRN